MTTGPTDLPSGVRRLGDFALGRRTPVIILAALPIGALSAGVAFCLLRLIGLITNLVFYGRVQTSLVAPGAGGHSPWLIVLAPVVGGLIVGVMARFGSEKIRGHGIPEAIESILIGGSKVQPRVALLKPVSAAITIGTGGPFGAEGPIIMTGGALGSLLAQLFSLTADERKTLLVAGAAAGMAATFNAPLASVLLAVELLLFEWRPRSFLPVAAAVAVATVMRGVLLGTGPVFSVHVVQFHLTGGVYALCALAGLLGGCLSVIATALVYASEDTFHRLPIHWMWWPAIGGLVIGVGGLIEPRALGVGYDVIRELLRGHAPMTLIVGILVVKTMIWSISLGSGTSGGVLAPVFMIGGALGALEAHVFPGVAPGFWSLVGLAAVVGGVMRAPFTGVVFSLEVTHEWGALLPLLIASASAYALSVFVLKRSILTEKIARRDLHLTHEYTVDPLEVLFVRDVMRPEIVCFEADSSLAQTASAFLEGQLDTSGEHHRQRLYPVLDGDRRLAGLVTSRDLLRAALHPDRDSHGAVVGDIARSEPIITYTDVTLREAANFMAEHALSRLPVVRRDAPDRVVGIVALADLLAARLVDLREERESARVLRIWRPWARRRPVAGRPVEPVPVQAVPGQDAALRAVGEPLTDAVLNADPLELPHRRIGVLGEDVQR